MKNLPLEIKIAAGLIAGHARRSGHRAAEISDAGDLFFSALPVEDRIAILQAQQGAVRNQLQLAQRALARYGRHTPTCAMMLYAAAACTCGYSAALAESREVI